MRTAIIVIVIVLGIVLLGGMIRLGGVPIFARIDAVLGTNILMTAHDTLFFFMHSAHQSIEDESTRANRELKEFQEKPIGIDKRGHYRKLDDAASY